MVLGFETRNDFPVSESPAWALQHELTDLKNKTDSGIKLSENEAKRLIELQTILSTKSVLK